MQYFKLKENIGSIFQGNDMLSKKQLVSEIRDFFPDLADNTITIYLSKLKKEGILYSASRGIYKNESTKQFQPFLSKFLKQTYKKISEAFPYINFCVGDTAWLNDFMVHQPFKNYMYVEIEKDATESVFNFLNERFKITTFLYSDKDLFDRYLNNEKDILIVKNLVSEAPLMHIGNVTVPSLEKLLVDILIDIELFSAQQSEKEIIIQNALTTFTVNKSKMLRYAQRRNRRKELSDLVNISLAKHM
ncbi:MAG: hypothetical protein QM305_10235 [Bacteroidota bacterium]|nr:hypothetical protein [Bacteroidota bacterium]